MARTRDGWWPTGDVAYADADGDLFLVDRLGELILVSGFNVYPHEVELVLGGHPGVAEAAVVPMADAATGQAVKAYVVRAADAAVSADELAGALRAQPRPVQVPGGDRVRAGAAALGDRQGAQGLAGPEVGDEPRRRAGTADADHPGAAAISATWPRRRWPGSPAASGEAWREVDVDSDPDLQAEYWDRVPVILLDGEEHGYWRVEEERLLRDLRCAKVGRVSGGAWGTWSGTGTARCSTTWNSS